MAYTPPDRHSLLFTLEGGHAPPSRHALAFELPTEDGGTGPEPVSRLVFKQISLRWRRGLARDPQWRMDFGAADRRDHDTAMDWSPPGRLDGNRRLPWQKASPADREASLPIEIAPAIATSADLPWKSPVAVDSETGTGWRIGRRKDGAGLALPWRDPPSRDREAGLRWQEPNTLDRHAWLAWDQGNAQDHQRRLAWNMGVAPNFRHLLPVPPQPQPPARPGCYQPDRHGLEVRLGTHGAAYAPPDRHALDFRLVCGDGRYFNIRKTLSMNHTLSVVRLPDRLPLAVSSIALSADRDSWNWTLRMGFTDVASLLAVEPTEEARHSVEITLDGHVFTALIDGFSEDRRFGERGGSVNGRSRTALLAAPDALLRSYTNADPATARQLALRELEFLDFALDWRIEDWEVPAGAWSYERESPITALAKIVAAAGAMLLSDTGSDTLIVAPRLPSAPWNFAAETPAFTLAGGSWLQKGKRWNGGGRYNGVFIGGRNAGILANVYRDGSSGSPYAQQVVDPLITATAPAMQRGLQIISDSLPRHEIPVELPLMPAPLAPGLLLPGELGAIEDTVWGHYRAIVDSVEIRAEVSADGLVTARQNATLWRYLP